MIVQRLLKIQKDHGGYLPDAELVKLAKEIDVPLYRLEEVASFFPGFRQERNKPPFVEIKVCRDMTCHLRGAASLLAEDGLPALASTLSQQCGKEVRVEGVSCLGRCDRAPVLWVERHDHSSANHNDHAAHEHGWVYAGKEPDAMKPIITAIAKGEKRPEPDLDLKHSLKTNAILGFDSGSPPAPMWEINVYGQMGQPRDYRGVRRFVEKHLIAYRRGSVPRPPQVDGKEMQSADLEKYLQEQHPMLWELKLSGLLGMGGAGAPTFQKWLDVWRQRSDYEDDMPDESKLVRFEKYIVANGDESEPGTFKDRELMLRLPHLVVEGVILAGLMTGATAGYIYVRHEFHEQIAALRAEIARAEEMGACGPNIFESGRNFSVEVFESPGGYICGEQSALIEAMEDRRSQPRNRPPELTTNGLRDRPTIVNNVETLAWIPYIMMRGGRAYAEQGERPFGDDGPGFGGRRFFSISGDVLRPGVFEVPIGTSLGDLIQRKDLCGGIRDGRKVAFVATSGPSGGLLPAAIPIDPKVRDSLPRSLAKLRERSAADGDLMQAFLDKALPADATHLNLLAVPLDLNVFRNLYTLLRLPVEPMLGAGITVYAEGRDPLEQATIFSRFFRNESCGKCVPCRIGSHKLTNIGLGLLARRDKEGITEQDLAAIQQDILEMTKTMQQTSICGLGYVAPIPLSSVLTYFPESTKKRSASGER